MQNSSSQTEKSVLDDSGNVSSAVESQNAVALTSDIPGVGKSAQHSNFHHHKHHKYHHKHHALRNIFRSWSDFWGGVRYLFRDRFSQCYIDFFIALFYVLILKSKSIDILRVISPIFQKDTYYRIQEYIVSHLNVILTVPMWIALAVIVYRLALDYYKHSKRFVSHFLKALPALIATVCFAVPHSADTSEMLARNKCLHDLRIIYGILADYAGIHSGEYPDSLKDIEIPDGEYLVYELEHYEYLGKGLKESSGSPVPLVVDAVGNHAGNLRFMLLSDGSIQVSKYGGEFVSLADGKIKPSVKSNVRVKRFFE